MNTLRIATAFVFASSIALSGCAKSPDKIVGTYVSPSTYSYMSCNQLIQERNAVVMKVDEFSVSQKKEANEDAVATGVALVLFWPAALFLADGGGNEAQLANLKGHYEALSTQISRKGCKVTA
ncbi:hypothetical protein N9P17_02575 [Tateyamaria sp.]|nr:hypothetical protein [Tateyamaria sp.]